MRAFVALEIPNKKVIDSMVAMQGELAKSSPDLKLVERENLHFTVKFLGEISDAQASQVDSRLRTLSLEGGDVEVKGVGAFPSVSRPSVIWAGVARENEEMVTRAAQSVIGALAGIGQEESRPFLPHATVARARSLSRNPHLESVLRANSDYSFGSVRLSSLKLKSSVLTPSGPLYSDIGEYQMI